MSGKSKQRCKKIQNPCKICLQPVTLKTGVQCNGACEAWVHFECLNFTPGKIKDILKGYITITCPCPDCKTTVPKEYMTDEAFTCNNVVCPANNPPACEEFDCQANELSRTMPSRCPPPGTLRTCNEYLCRDYSGPNAYKSRPTDCMGGYTVKTSNDERTRVLMPDGQILCDTMPCPQANQLNKMTGTQPQPVPAATNQQGPIFSPVAVQQMCKTVGDLAQQLNNLMDSLKGMGGGGTGGGGAGGGMMPCGSSGISCGGKAGCNKCGQGGAQAQGKKLGCTGGCGQAGQAGCAQPCHCPGNPLKKHR